MLLVCVKFKVGTNDVLLSTNKELKASILEQEVINVKCFHYSYYSTITNSQDHFCIVCKSLLFDIDHVQGRSEEYADYEYEYEYEDDGSKRRKRRKRQAPTGRIFLCV